MPCCRFDAELGEEIFFKFAIVTAKDAKGDLYLAKVRFHAS